MGYTTIYEEAQASFTEQKSVRLTLEAVRR